MTAHLLSLASRPHYYHHSSHGHGNYPVWLYVLIGLGVVAFYFLLRWQDKRKKAKKQFESGVFPDPPKQSEQR